MADNVEEGGEGMSLEEAKEKRRAIFQANCASFLKAQTATDFGRLGSGISVDLVENADEMINNYYWNFIESFVRPRIKAKTFKTYVDLYKILSVTEYAIMSVKPFFILKDGLPVNYEVEKDIFHTEMELNAECAFQTAINILKEWDGYKGIFGDGKVKTFLYEFKEPVERRTADAMMIGVEHVFTIAYSTIDNPTLPIFTNAGWWRMFCLAGDLKNKLLNN
ncbi:MAG: hypothetical protein JST90_14810 [Bacteroidetes bacterium]|nr:hypothetical protein [Bacteroidota bacterium]